MNSFRLAMVMALAAVVIYSWYRLSSFESFAIYTTVDPKTKMMQVAVPDQEPDQVSVPDPVPDPVPVPALVPALSEFKFPLQKSKWLDDIDTSHVSTSCGTYKCFLPSKSNRQRLDESSIQYGYLVVIDQTTFWKEIVEGWELASELSETFGIRHFLRGPPKRMKSTKSLSERLRRITTMGPLYEKIVDEHKGKNLRPAPGIRSNRSNFDVLADHPESKLIVQPVEVAPANAILFKLKGVSTLDYTSDSTNSSSSSSSSSGDSSSLFDFEQRLRFDANATIVALMNSTLGSCLQKDFQVIIDPFTGGIYHLDFDRCFAKDLKRGTFCPRQLLTFAEDLLRKRTTASVDERSNTTTTTTTSSSSSIPITALASFFEEPEHCKKGKKQLVREKKLLRKSMRLGRKHKIT